DVAAELHPTKNGKLTAKTIIAASPALRYWTCSDCNEIYKQSPCARTRNGTGCPKCNWGERLDLRKYPQALRMFDKTKNKTIDPKSMHCREKVWWKCPKASDHK